MCGGQDKFTTCEIIDLLDQNYGIPFNGGGGVRHFVLTL